MEQLSFTLRPQQRFYTVSELTSELKALFTNEYDDIRVSGEISGLKIASSGHAYFTLKDQTAQIRCALYRNAMRFMKVKPQDGLAVVARGTLDIWEARGDYQLIVSAIEPQGFGALQLAFEQLKKRLEAEGLFSAERKRAIPRFPRRIGIVTSPSGAVIRDMLNVIGRRYRGVQVRLYPALVQGEGAAAAIGEGIRHFSRSQWADVVIVARGGGSLEDLWAFNEEVVARAIVACSVPVISAVGHETDFTIADFVADLRAPTPSAAAELVVPNTPDLLARVGACREAVARSVRYLLARLARRLQENGIDRATALLHRRIGRGLQGLDDFDFRMRSAAAHRLDAQRRAERDLERRLLRHDPRLRLAGARQRLNQCEARAGELIRMRLALAHGKLEPVCASLTALSPLHVLERGYAIVQTAGGRVVKNPIDAPAQSRLRITLSEGQIMATVDSEGPAAP